MSKEYASLQFHHGVLYRVDTGAPNRSAQDAQFDGLKGHPLGAVLNKMAEFDYAPIDGVIDHGGEHPGAANFTFVVVREK